MRFHDCSYIKDMQQINKRNNLEKECGRREQRRNKCEGRTYRIGFTLKFPRKIQICSIYKTVDYKDVFIYIYIYNKIFHYFIYVPDSIIFLLFYFINICL